MKAVIAQQGRRTQVAKAEPISLDMTKAITMEPMPDNTEVLCAVSAWEVRRSAAENRTLHVEMTIIKPEEAGYKGRKLFDDINLQNEYTLGRLLNHLKGLGFSEEDIRKPDFVLPKTEDMLGLQTAVVVGVRKSDRYGDRNTIKRSRPADTYGEGAY